ncbi:MAG: class I SAM-dependent methyltransferase [Burkholderiales bacterium]|nr:class I SAM-dependent methyltransferase [Burkholderiales bacterium]
MTTRTSERTLTRAIAGLPERATVVLSLARVEPRSAKVMRADLPRRLEQGRGRCAFRHASPSPLSNSPRFSYDLSCNAPVRRICIRVIRPVEQSSGGYRRRTSLGQSGVVPVNRRTEATNRAGPSGPGRSFEDQWRRRFQAFAEQRDDDAGIAGWSASGLDARLRRFARLLGPQQPAERWLDAGCGAGTYTRLLLEKGLCVTGIDYSVPSLVKARARSPVDVSYAAADVRRLPFRPETFDGVVCFGVMQALADATPALRELGGLVRPGGEIWVDALNRTCVVNAYEILRRRFSGRPQHLRYESAAKLKAELSAAGFVRIVRHWMPIVPARWPKLQRLAETPLVGWALRRVPLLGALSCHGFILHGERPGPG